MVEIGASLLGAEFELQALTESQGFSKELTEKAWLQLVIALISGEGGLTGCGYSKEYHEDKNGASRSSKEEV